MRGNSGTSRGYLDAFLRCIYLASTGGVWLEHVNLVLSFRHYATGKRIAGSHTRLARGQIRTSSDRYYRNTDLQHRVSIFRLRQLDSFLLRSIRFDRFRIEPRRFRNAHGVDCELV